MTGVQTCALPICFPVTIGPRYEYPLVDRFRYSYLGHYRSWILPCQWLSVLVLIGLSFLPIESLNHPIYLWVFFVALLGMNLVGATQDIATDGLAVNILQAKQQHWGNTFQVVGSRLGFIVGGGAILWALDWLDWQKTFLILAALVFLNTLPILMFKEPQHAAKQVLVQAQSKMSFHARLAANIVTGKQIGRAHV